MKLNYEISRKTGTMTFETEFDPMTMVSFDTRNIVDIYRNGDLYIGLYSASIDFYQNTGKNLYTLSPICNIMTLKDTPNGFIIFKDRLYDALSQSSQKFFLAHEMSHVINGLPSIEGAGNNFRECLVDIGTGYSSEYICAALKEAQCIMKTNLTCHTGYTKMLDARIFYHSNHR